MNTKKIVPYSAEYTKLKINLALDVCPPIHPCQKCGHPVVSGYCCTGCGDSNPTHPAKEDDNESPT